MSNDKDFDYQKNYNPFSDYEILTKNGLRRRNKDENRLNKTDITFIDSAIEGEIYYPIPSHPGFSISNHGRVRSDATGRNLKIYLDRWCVRHVKFPNENGTRMMFSIQKMMREVFFIPKWYRIKYLDNDIYDDLDIKYENPEDFEDDESLDEVAGGYFEDENSDFEDV